MTMFGMFSFGLFFCVARVKARIRRPLVLLLAVIATWTVASSARAGTPADVIFDFAAGGANHLTVNGSAINVTILTGHAGLTVDDAPCTTGGDGETICGYNIRYLMLYLTDFSAGGHSYVQGVVTTTSSVHVFASNGRMTIPAGTAASFGATVDGTRGFVTDVTPAALTLTMNLATQQASLTGGFQGTMDGTSVDVGISATAVSPFVNLPPTVNAGPDTTVHGHGPFIQVPLSGTVTDAQGGVVMGADWRENGAIIAQGANTTTMLAPGTHTLTFEAFDSFGGHGSDTVVIQVAPGMTIGPAGNRLEYFYCGQEGGTCSLSGKKYVAYGANGQFIFRAVTGSIPCSINYFGVDPIVGVVKSCYFANAGLDVSENGTGAAPAGGVEVAYGANGVFTFGRFSGSYSCSNATFGDPIPGVGKACYQAVPGYNAVAVDFGNMSGLNNTWVAYGAHGSFIYKILSGTAPCLPSTFGYDPLFGVQKTCYAQAVGTPIASEGQSFTRSGPVLYGSGQDGNYLTTNSSGSLVCNNGTFGGDPHVFVGKICYALPVVP